MFVTPRSAQKHVYTFVNMYPFKNSFMYDSLYSCILAISILERQACVQEYDPLLNPRKIYMMCRHHWCDGVGSPPPPPVAIYVEDTNKLKKLFFLNEISVPKLLSLILKSKYK